MVRWAFVGMLCLAASLQAQELDPVIQKAKFIFIGDVVKLGSSTMPSVPPSANTAVVRVRKVLAGEQLLGGFAGREITVTMQQPSRHQNAVFFTNVTVYGQSLAAEEVAPPRIGVSGADIAAAQRRNDARAAQERKAKAAVIVAGRVIEVRPLHKGRPWTEHDPMWELAVVQVEKVRKGSAGPTVEVLFPSSNDEMWRKWPKFVKGDAGVWTLERNELGLVTLEFERGAR